MMKRFLLLPLFLFACTAARATEPTATPKADPVKGQATAAMCVACHSADGNSVVSTYPKLAGQHAEYLIKQLHDFKTGERANPMMSGMAAPLSDVDMHNVAAWFASQTQKPDVAKNKETVELGQKLYRSGDQAKGLPACAACHGPAGMGIPVQYPRLAGQFADYTAAQLKAFRAAGSDAKDPAGRSNDANKAMRMVAVKMTDAEIKAVADYIAGLR
jgi:cytochrome c553